MIDIPQSRHSGKNSADIHMVVDAHRPVLRQAAHRHLRAAVGRQRLLAAGLQAQGERQAGDRLRREEFDLGSADPRLRRVHLLRRPRTRGGQAEAHRAKTEKPDKKARGHGPAGGDRRVARHGLRPAVGLDGQADHRRVHPGFSESYYGYKSFSDLLKDAESRGLIRLEYDEKPRQLSRQRRQLRQRQTATYRSLRHGTYADPPAPRPERVEPEEPVHRLGGRRPDRTGPGRGCRGGTADRGRGPRLRSRLYLHAETRHPHAVDRDGCDGPHVGAGDAGLGAE